jgi:glycosyltransferase involved in cell wall biosynthesis
MKILMVNHYALPPSQAGGTRHYSLAKGLIRRGHEVVIVASSFDHDSRTDRLGRDEAFRLETLDGVPFLWLKTPAYHSNGPARLWNMLAFSRALGRHALGQTWARPDLILGSSPHPFAALACQRLAQRLEIPFVLEIRDVWPQSLIDVMGISRHHPIVWVLARIERELYRRADHIITLLPTVARRVAACGGDPSAITYVSNGIDLDMVPAPAPPPARDTFTFIYPGALGVSNALDVMVDAAILLQEREARLPKRLDLVLMGHGPERERLQARVARAGLRNFRFLDPVPKREVYQVLATADAFWSSSQATGLWEHGISFNKLFDFMAMARPTLIGLDAPNNPIAEAGAGIVVAPGDAAALAEGIEQLMARSDQDRWAMGLRGAAYVKAHFCSHTLAGQLEAALLETASLCQWRAHAS